MTVRMLERFISLPRSSGADDGVCVFQDVSHTVSRDVSLTKTSEETTIIALKRRKSNNQQCHTGATNSETNCIGA